MPSYKPRKPTNVHLLQPSNLSKSPSKIKLTLFRADLNSHNSLLLLQLFWSTCNFIFLSYFYFALFLTNFIFILLYQSRRHSPLLYPSPENTLPKLRCITWSFSLLRPYFVYSTLLTVISFGVTNFTEKMALQIFHRIFWIIKRVLFLSVKQIKYSCKPINK